jgi:hypothetical protein
MTSDEGKYDVSRIPERIRDFAKRVRYSRKRRFAVSLLSSFAVLILITFLIIGGYAQIIATFASIGGISAEIGELRGNDVKIYPAVGESSNCPWQTTGTFSGPQDDEGRYQNPVSASDQALPMLKADISDATVPAGYGVSFVKDIELPDYFGPDAFRISIKRNESLVPEPVSLPYDGTPAATTATDQFIRSVRVEPNNATVGAAVVPLQEATGFDRASGRRDLTQARIYLVEGTSYNIEVSMDTVKAPSPGEVDRAYNYVKQNAEAGFYIDWDQTGVLGSSEEYIIGSGDGGSDGIETVSTDFTVQDPGGDLQTGSTLMRVMMNVSGPVNDPDGDIPRGMVEDYTVVVVDSVNDIPEPAKIGDASLKTTGLEAGFLDLRGGSLGSEFVLGDKYSEDSSGGTSNPVFAADPPPQGEFYLQATGSGQNVRIRNASARLHQLAFTSLDISFLELDLSYINDSEANIATQQCPILEPAFLPSITNAPYNVSPSETFSFDYQIRNPGIEPETQTVDVEFPEGTVQTFSDTVDPTTAKDYTNTTTAPSTTGRYDLVIDPQDEPPSSSAREEIIVGSPPDFQVNLDGVSPDPVVAEDEVLEVQTTVTNTGDVVGTQDITLSVGGETKDFNERTIDSGGSQTFNFSYTPVDRDAGLSVPVKVSSRDDFDTQSIEIKESPQFEVNITDSNAPVDSGDNEVLSVFANVTNIGGAQDTQDITLDIENSQAIQDDVDNVTGLSLNPGETTPSDLEFTYTTSDPEDPPSVRASVSSDDDTSSRVLRINGSGVIFQVDGVTPRPDSVEPDDQIEFDAQITNVGPKNGTQDVELNVTSDELGTRPNVNATSLFLNSTETENVSLFYTAEDGDAPELQGEVLTRNQTTGEKVDSNTANVSVTEPAFFEPSVVGAENEPVEGQDELEVGVDVTNTGGLIGDGTVTLEVDTNQDGTYDKTADVQVIQDLSPGTSERRYLNYTTEDGDATAVDIRVRGYTTRRVAEDFDEGGSEPSGWTFENNASVSSDTSNSGSYSAFTCCNSNSNVTSPAVDTTYYSDTGVVALDYWVRKGADSFSENPDSNEDLEVQFLNDNGNWITFETLDDDDINDGEKVTRIDATIASPDAIHENFRLRFRQTGGSGSGDDYWHIDDVAVKSGDVDGTDEVSGIGVLTPPFYDVTILGTNEPITAGETLDVVTNVTNTGQADGSQQEIALEDDDTVQQDSFLQQLNSGGSVEQNLTWTTDLPGVGTYSIYDDWYTNSVSVSSENDTDTQNVDIQVPIQSFDPGTEYGGDDDGQTNSIGLYGEEIHLEDVFVYNWDDSQYVINTACGDGDNRGYRDCTGSSPTNKMSAGDKLGIYTSSRGDWSGGDGYFRAWVDWDGDGSLSDETAIDIGFGSGGGGYLLENFTVPNSYNDAPAGTRLLRVVLDGQDQPTWDEPSNWYGEKEDFRVTIDTK